MDKSDFSVEQANDVTVVVFVDGCTLDTQTVQRISSGLYRLVEKPAGKTILFDFENIRFMSSQALGMLLTLQRKAKKAGAGVAFSAVNEKLMRVFQVTSLDGMFQVFTDRNEALGALKSPV
jgi:anti-sigma B factor antagonist